MRTATRRTSVVPIMLLCAATVAIPASGATLTAAAGAAAGYAGPARDVVVRPMTLRNTQHFTSRNWGGYISYPFQLQPDINVVKATWVQPVVHCEAAQAWTVFWVGIDGWFNNTVEQGGSSAYCPVKGGAPRYELWWEMYPTVAIQETLPTKAGDTITASVRYVPATKRFVIVVKDVTSGKSFTKNEACASGLTCSRTSADVITEDVGRFGSGGYFPLANYGTMTYTGSGVTDVAGHHGAIASPYWNDAAVTEASGGVTYATVSALSAAGTSFRVTWKHQ